MPGEPEAKRAKGEWNPTSWHGKHTGGQMAEWPDKAVATTVLEKLSKLPPLVLATEADTLKKKLAEAGRGERFIVQGGDCAERFMDCEADRLEAQMRLMVQFSMIVEHVSKKPSLCICRVAGQYGKPRSKPTEVVEGYGEIMSFKGDNINGFAPTERKWDPERLLQGYFHSAATLNYLRAISAKDDLNKFAKVDVEKLNGHPEIASLQAKAKEMEAKYAKSVPSEFYTAHEGMQLDLEEALTRKVAGKYYNLSAHFIWIGDRTRQLDGAHIEYFRGIANPVGVKVGPSMKPDELKELVQVMNPNREEGKLVLITRYGAGKVEDMLPTHIQAVKESGVPVVWQCDGVHGNGIVASNKYKTRKVADIQTEVLKAIEVHKKCGSILGGIHLEMSGQESITECLGGCIGLTEEMLTSNYETFCDPRLNYAQAVETAFKVAANL
mmetsp:Transcript_46264/g.110067  ORF Transcript_46264/g.110067 Transcript_46264/m.110067 type:complete len:439 (-) Transcript_46264:68-1384(-)